MRRARRRSRATVGSALARSGLALALGACGCPEGQVAVEVVRADEGATLGLCAELAATEEARRLGLMGRPPLGPDEGMLFVVPVDQELCLYNAGVSFAIDILYADAGGRVIAIERDVPAGDETVRCHAPAAQVLEVRGGLLEGFAPGDRMRSPATDARP